LIDQSINTTKQEKYYENSQYRRKSRQPQL
jgi:hypothetical protein